MKIKIALPEDLKDYDKYEVVYISDGEIKERSPQQLRTAISYLKQLI